MHITRCPISLAGQDRLIGHRVICIALDYPTVHFARATRVGVVDANRGPSVVSLPGDLELETKETRATVAPRTKWTKMVAVGGRNARHSTTLIKGPAGTY